MKARTRARRYRDGHLAAVKLRKRRAYIRDVHGMEIEQYERALERRCDWCSVEFKAARMDAPWCSWDCRKRAVHLRRKYGMTTDDLRTALAAQAFRCAGCGDPINFANRQIDHDHVTKRLRGLLCAPCNLTIGNAKESIDRLVGIIAYLRIS